MASKAAKKNTASGNKGVAETPISLKKGEMANTREEIIARVLEVDTHILNGTGPPGKRPGYIHFRCKFGSSTELKFSGCKASVNTRRLANGKWVVTTFNLTHNDHIPLPLPPLPDDSDSDAGDELTCDELRVGGGSRSLNKLSRLIRLCEPNFIISITKLRAATRSYRCRHGKHKERKTFSACPARARVGYNEGRWSITQLERAHNNHEPYSAEDGAAIAARRIQKHSRRQDYSQKNSKKTRSALADGREIVFPKLKASQEAICAALGIPMEKTPTVINLISDSESDANSDDEPILPSSSKRQPAVSTKAQDKGTTKRAVNVPTPSQDRNSNIDEPFSTSASINSASKKRKIISEEVPANSERPAKKAKAKPNDNDAPVVRKSKEQRKTIRYEKLHRLFKEYFRSPGFVAVDIDEKIQFSKPYSQDEWLFIVEDMKSSQILDWNALRVCAFESFNKTEETAAQLLAKCGVKSKSLKEFSPKEWKNILNHIKEENENEWNSLSVWTKMILEVRVARWLTEKTTA